MPFTSPDVFGGRLPVVGAHEYLGVRAVEDEFGEVVEIRLWLYQEGSFVEELAVLDAGELETAFGFRSEMAATLAIIHEDPSGLVGRSIFWRGVKDIHVVDFDDLTYYRGVTTAGGEPFASAPIWGGDGWIYYHAGPGDSPFGFWRFHKIRANGTGDVEVSTLVGGITFDLEFAHLAGSAYYVYSPASVSGGDDDLVGIFPLNGDAASVEIATGMAGLVSDPYHHGVLAAGGETAVFLRGEGGPLRLGIFTPPSTEALLWPDDWVAWEDPADLDGPVLSLSLNPAGTEAVVYAAIPDGGGGRGILRTDLEEKAGSEPTGIVVVSAHEGEYPDFMLALD